MTMLEEGADTEKFTEEDYRVEKEWHGVYQIPTVDIIDVFKGAFDRKKEFDISAWD